MSINIRSETAPGRLAPRTPQDRSASLGEPLSRGAEDMLRGAARVAKRNERALGAFLWLLLLAVLIAGSS